MWPFCSHWESELTAKHILFALSSGRQRQNSINCRHYVFSTEFPAVALVARVCFTREGIIAMRDGKHLLVQIWPALDSLIHEGGCNGVQQPHVLLRPGTQTPAYQCSPTAGCVMALRWEPSLEVPAWALLFQVLLAAQHRPSCPLK